MPLSELLLRSTIAIILGALIGLKNQISSTRQESRTLLGGFRSYALLALLGVISGAMYLNQAYALSAIVSGGVVLIILIYYAEGAFVAKALGITDETTGFFAHFIGFLAISNIVPINYLIALAVLVVFVVTRKKEIHAWSTHISEEEVAEFTLFAILALVILPFLPNHALTLHDMGLGDFSNLFGGYRWQQIFSIELINPFRLWFIVVLISGLNLLSYILSKFTSNQNSLFVSSLLGGLVSSTSVTVALAIKSKEMRSKDQVMHLVAAALGSNAVSFIPIMLLVAPISGALLQALIPSLLVFIGAFMVAAWYLRWHYRHKTIRTSVQHPHHILSLGPIFKFAMILAIVQIVSQFALLFAGHSGLVVTSLAAGATGIDAVTVSLASLVNTGVITISLAYATFMGVNFINLISKTFYSYQSGNKYYAHQFGLYASLVMTASLLVGLFVR